MDEKTARKVLEESGFLHTNNRLEALGRYVSWSPAHGPDFVCLDDDAFTADELEAIAWWMRNKRTSNAP